MIIHRLKTTGSFRIVFVLFLTLAALDFHPVAFADAPVDPAALLFQAFSSKCDSEGSFTSQALSDSTALEGILTTIVQDPACQGLRPVLNQVTTIGGLLSRVQTGFGNQPQKDYSAYEQRLVLMLSATTDPTIQGDLIGEIAATRIDVAKQKLISAQADRQAQAMALTNISQYMTLVKDTYSTQSICFLNHPDLPFQMASQVMSLSGGLFSSGTGAAVSLAGSLMSDLIDLIKNEKIAKSIRRYRSSRLGLALSCAAEALEQTLCTIRDQRDLFKIHDKYWEGKTIPQEWLGFHILYDEYPILQNFLLQIESGAPAQSILQGSQISSIRQVEGMFRGTLAQLDGYLGDAEHRLAILIAQKASADRIQLLYSNLIVSSMASMGYMAGSSSSFVGGIGVYSEILPTNEAASRLEIWIRTGSPDPIVDIHTSQTPYASYLANLKQTASVDLSTIRANLQAINDKARAQLDLDKSLVLNPDQQGALANWIFSTRIKVDVGTSIKNSIIYFDSLQNDWSSHPEWFSDAAAQRDGVNLIENTRLHFANTLAILQREKPKAEDSQKAIQDLYEEMSLQEQDQVITARIQQIVENDLQIRLAHHLLGEMDSLENVLALGSQDAMTSLSPSPNNQTEEAKMDAEAAASVAESNLDSFFVSFKDSILKSFDILWADSIKWQTGWDGPQRRQIAKICMLILNSSEITTKGFKDLRNWCEPQILSESVKGEKIQIQFKDLLARSKNDINLRLCSFRDFKNKVDLKRRRMLDQTIQPSLAVHPK